MVNKGFSDKIWISYSKTEYVDTVDEIEHNIIRESLKLLGINKRVYISYMSDLLPGHEGSGLGASSSLTVGILHALHAYKGEKVSKEQLSQEACQIEIEILGHPMGKQDQYAAAYGGMNFIRFNPDGTVVMEPISLDAAFLTSLRQRLLLFYTGLHAKSKNVLPEQDKKTDENITYLNRLLELSKAVKQSLLNKRFEDLGAVLDEGWQNKKKLANNITNNAIDTYYEKAMKAGAGGGKLLGSGGGGFLIVYCDKAQQNALRDTLQDLKEEEYSFEDTGSIIVYNDSQDPIQGGKKDE